MSVNTDVSCEAVFDAWLGRLGNAMAALDGQAIAALFLSDGYWKDILAFSGGYRTWKGAREIARGFDELAGFAHPRGSRVSEGRAAPHRVRRSARDIIEAYFDFSTDAGKGTGFVRIQLDATAPLESKAWIMLTTLQEIEGHGEQIGTRRPTGVNYSHNFAGPNWLDDRIAEARFDDRDPQVVIVGAGQGGLILGARLRQMGADALIIEQNARIGDNWRKRYHSLTLHNEVWANSMPYMEFPATWPTFVPKDKIAGWLEAYAEAMELNVWTSTRLTGSQYDSAEGIWTLEVTTADGPRVVRTPHLVLAIGGSTGVPNIPAIPGLANFSGDVIHSGAFTGGIPYAGKHAVVFGTGTSGHDVAQDLYANGAASVTMIQRSPTCVVSLVPSGTLVYALYSEGPSNDDIDLITAAIPYEVLRETYQWLTRKTCELDRGLIDRLEAVGFRTDYGEDGTGFHMMYLRKGGGYYINVGCSDLIADRKIALIQSDVMDRIVPEGIRMTDGSLLRADLLVMATGYRNLQEGIGTLVGQEIAAKVGPVWGFDENHIMRNMWQRTTQPGLWIMGGSLIDARLYSRFLAVQIVADLNGVRLGPSDR
jgi:cation diffusion facilitator CzcD-associated flavoprotein CzcO